MSSTKLRRAAKKTLSVGLTATTSLWLTGSAFLVAVPAAHASNQAVSTDVTGDNPRIASNGESERVFLGLNLIRTDNTDVVQLGFVQVHLGSNDSGAEAAVANVEEVRLYADSTLLGTNGSFEESDGLIHSVVATETGGASTTVSTTQVLTFEDDLDLTSVAGLSAGDALKIGTGSAAEIREIASVVTNDTAAGDACAAAAGANPCVTLTADTGSLRTSTTVVRELADIAQGTVDEFDAFAAGETAVQLGDTSGGAVMTGAYDIPKTDASSEEGDDVFVVLVTAGGLDGQTITAQVHTGDVGYRNVTQTSDTSVTVGSGVDTTDGTTKDVEFGADGDAPSITKVETYDNDKDGRVDRVKAYFSESMADTVTGTDNFVDTLGGDAEEIDANGSNDDDIDLESNGTWSTTTVLNDTFQIDFEDDVDNPNDGETAGEYNDAANSTGDQWTVIYDEDKNVAEQLVDATGENLTDESVNTTDMARPEFVRAELKDNDGDDKVDELEVTWSESLDQASDASGYTLTNTTDNPDTDYTLGAVTQFKKSSVADSNSNDTMVIEVNEESSDVNDTFVLDYSASATVLDEAGNEANSETNATTSVDVAPRIEKVEYSDADANGQLDRVTVTFTRSVDVDNGHEGDFAVAGYGALTDTSGDADGVTSIAYSFAEKTFDTDETPELTYNKGAGDAANICLSNADTDCQPATDDDSPLENVVAGDIVEEDKAAPIVRSVTLYESDNDSIWETGETLQILGSEPFDAGQIETGWNESGADGTVFVDWKLGGGTADDNEIPDSGTISVAGNVITLTATEDASDALDAADEFDLIANEIKDAAGNSALVLGGGIVNLALELNPSAPTVSRIETRDLDGNGVLDALEVEFGGMIAASTITMSEWAAARGANAFGTENVSPDLTLTSVATVSGGDDTRILVSFVESNEGTGALPAVKYTATSTLQDLAENDIDDINTYSSDDELFESPLGTASVDGADPVSVLKWLRDRNGNGEYDQFIGVFSEAMDTGTTSTDGWEVSGHSLASAGTWSSNTGDYDMYTFADTDNVFKVDIVEEGLPTELPGVVYASTGAFADANGLVLADVDAGGEVSEVTEFTGPLATVDDGELFQFGNDVWIAKHVNGKKFRRHVLWSDFDVIYPHLAPMWPVQMVDQATYDMYSLSAWIRVAGTAPVYEVNDDMTAHWITCDDDPVEGEDCANEWLAAGGDPDGIFEINGEGGEWERLTLSNDVVLPDVAN